MATGKPSSQMAAKEPRIHAAMPRTRFLTRAECSFVVFSCIPTRLALAKSASSEQSCMSASASSENPILHRYKRARNHHSRTSHKLQAKNMTNTSEKTNEDREITCFFSNEVTGSFAVPLAFCLFLLLRHA